MREVYATTRGEGLVAGIISEPSKIVLCLAVRDNEEQTGTGVCGFVLLYRQVCRFFFPGFFFLGTELFRT